MRNIILFSIVIIFPGYLLALTGSGTESDPYQINSLADFDTIAGNSAYWDDVIWLNTDINLDGRTYNAAVIAPDTNHVSTGHQGPAFTGVFNGNGFTVSKLTVQTSGAERHYLGFFGKIEDAEIRNFRFENILIEAGDRSGYIGGLCGQMLSGTIADCFAEGRIIGSDFSIFLGGLCGENSSGTLSACQVNISVSGGAFSGNIGAFCGSSNGTIINCHTEGSVGGNDNAFRLGGLCGFNDGTISDCYATGPVNGGLNSYDLGGLCGKNDDQILNCYAAGPVSGGNNSSSSGGLVGRNLGTITNSYATGLVSGGNGSVALGGLTGSNRNMVTASYAAGEVTGGSSAASLGGLCGETDGIITASYATGPVSGGNYCRFLGGLCGSVISRFDIIRDCYAAGPVSGGDNSYDMGGLCGKNNNGQILNCYAIGSVTGGTNSRNSAGLCGYQTGDYAKIENSFWDTEISGLTKGYNRNSSSPGTITNVYGLSTAEMHTQSTYTDAGWDFLAVWWIDNNYPRHDYERPYGGGQGTSQDPYRLASADHLLELANQPLDYNKYFRVMRDIDLVGYSFSTALIAPDTDNTTLTFDGTPFSGVFDGNDKTIRNLTIDTGGIGNDYLGLFGLVNSEVKRLGIENVQITGADTSIYLGGLCGGNRGTISLCHTTGLLNSGSKTSQLGGLSGQNSGIIRHSYTNCVISVGDNSQLIGGFCGSNNIDGLISNCYAGGPVSAGHNSQIIGGFCGYNQGMIRHCYTDAPVYTERNSLSVGGLCGDNRDTIANSHATGSVNGDTYAFQYGGLCGVNQSGGTISNCFSTGSINVGDNAEVLGGLSGSNLSNSVIYNCYAAGSITTGTNPNKLGGLCGEQSHVGNGDAVIENCFWDTQTSGLETGSNQHPTYPGTVLNLIGLQTIDMQKKSTFADAGWDFLNTWWIDQGNGYPQYIIDLPFTAGQGTQADPYHIAAPADWLRLIARPRKWSSNFILTADLDMTGLFLEPVGTPSDPFRGELEGDNHTMSNVKIHQPGSSYVGLFGRTNQGQVRNLKLIHADITGFSFTGGLIGNKIQGLVTGCHVTGKVTASDAYIGGLIGVASGPISQCSTNVSVSTVGRGSYVGGLLGANLSQVTGCFSVGPVAGKYIVGGLIGWNLSGTIQDCYAGGAVTADSSVGGFMGYGGSGKIQNCYSAGPVTGTENTGAFTGRQESGFVLNNSVWDIQTSGLTDAVGSINPDPEGVAGKTTFEMKTLSISWDFDDSDGDPAVWMMLRYGEDYPRLAWQEIFIGDIAGLYGVDLVDFARLASHWTALCNTEDNCNGADIDENGEVDMMDLSLMAENFYKGKI